MKAIIIGGAGFIGSHLSDYLVKKKFKIKVIDNLSTGRIENLDKIKNHIKFLKFDISKKGKWQKEFKNTELLFWIIFQLEEKKI